MGPPNVFINVLPTSEKLLSALTYHLLTCSLRTMADHHCPSTKGKDHKDIADSLANGTLQQHILSQHPLANVPASEVCLPASRPKHVPCEGKCPFEFLPEFFFRFSIPRPY